MVMCIKDMKIKILKLLALVLESVRQTPYFY